MIRTFNNIGIKRKFSNLRKFTYKKPTANVHTENGKTEDSPPIRNKMGYPHSLLFNSHISSSLLELSMPMYYRDCMAWYLPITLGCKGNYSPWQLPYTGWPSFTGKGLGRFPRARRVWDMMNCTTLSDSNGGGVEWGFFSNINRKDLTKFLPPSIISP